LLKNSRILKDCKAAAGAPSLRGNNNRLNAEPFDARTKIPNLELLLENPDANARKTVAALQYNLMTIVFFHFLVLAQVGNYNGVDV
jgi:hypothetical protein